MTCTPVLPPAVGPASCFSLLTPVPTVVRLAGCAQDLAWKIDNVTQFPVQAWCPGLARGWAGLWSCAPHLGPDGAHSPAFLQGEPWMPVQLWPLGQHHTPLAPRPLLWLTPAGRVLGEAASPEGALASAEALCSL